MLSLRYKTNDQLWFSLFHEAGHILRHGKKKIFLEFNHGGAQAEEAEADRFAANLLIPPRHHQELFSLGSNKQKVVAFAEWNRARDWRWPLAARRSCAPYAPERPQSEIPLGASVGDPVGNPFGNPFGNPKEEIGLRRRRIAV